MPRRQRNKHGQRKKKARRTAMQNGREEDGSSNNSIPSSSPHLDESSDINKIDYSSNNQVSQQQSINIDYVNGNQQENFSSINSTNTDSNGQHCSNHRVCGLQNLGNTCYMNGILQCLNSTTPLVDYFHLSESVNNDGLLCKAFANLLQTICRSNYCDVSPSCFKASLGRYAPKFLGYQQQDSHEFLTAFLEAIVQETTDSNGFSIISDLFEGQMEYTIQCLHPGCSYTKVDTDPFMTLSLFIEDKTSSSPSSSSISSCEKDPRLFRVHCITHDGLLQVEDIPIRPNDTIETLNRRIQSKPNFNSCVMKINEKNGFVGEYDHSVLLSAIKNQMTIFYELVKDDQQYTNILLLFRDINSPYSGFIHPPIIVPIRNGSQQHDIVLEITKYLRNLLVLQHGFAIMAETNHPSSWVLPYAEMAFNVWSNEKDFENSKWKLVNKSAHKEIGKQLNTLNMNQSSTTLERCLSNISITEYMSSNSVWYCSVCGENRKSSKQNRLVSVSKVLVIQLKRFNFSSASPYHKVERLVQYPLQLDIAPFLSPESHDSNSPSLYDLIGVCLHSGTLAGGHTTAYAKNAVQNQWYYCNDSQVYAVSENDVINKDTRNAYILFYLRRPKD